MYRHGSRMVPNAGSWRRIKKAALFVPIASQADRAARPP